MIGDAVISECGRYRYHLARIWRDGPCLPFVMLNPSTADAAVDDPTIRRCVGFAKAWGYSGLVVRNAFALRATDPKALRGDVDPIGPDNDTWLADLNDTERFDRIVLAWGTHATLYGRDRDVRALLRSHPRVEVLGLTKDGHPKHPLYIPAATTPTAWAA